MNKEDYMKLSKGRLAELLAERDREPVMTFPYPLFAARPQCYEPGGVCTNPQRDCVNCPHPNMGIGHWTTTTTNTTKKDD